MRGGGSVTQRGAGDIFLGVVTCSASSSTIKFLASLPARRDFHEARSGPAMFQPEVAIGGWLFQSFLPRSLRLAVVIDFLP